MPSFEHQNLYDFFDDDDASNNAIEVVRLPGESIIEQAHAEHPDIEQREYQIDCLAALMNARSKGERRALIHMATGLGKTTVAALDVKSFLQQRPQDRVLFIAHQNQILRQAKARFEHILGDSYTYGTYNGESKDGYDAKLVFASFQQLHHSRDEFASDAFGYVVVDESHHSKAVTYEPTLHYFSPEFLLGMTATPDRRDLKEIREIFGNEVYTKTLDKALEERLVAYPDYKVILDEVGASAFNNMDDKTLGDLNRTIFIPKRDEEIAKIIRRHAETITSPKTIVFCPSIEHADRMAALIDGAYSLHSQQAGPRRQELLEQLVEGSIHTLTAVDMLNEGVDIADANVIVFLRSTQSETIFLQQLGRGLRKVSGKNSVLVLDFVASCDRLLMIDNLFGKYIEDRPSPDDKSNLGHEDDLYEVEFNENNLQVREILDAPKLTFNESARKIINIVRTIANKQPPEGQESLRSLARELSIEKRSLLIRLGHLGIEVSLATDDFDTLKNSYISHDDAQKLREYNAGPPEGYLSLSEAGEVLGVEYATVIRHAKLLSLEVRHFLGGNKRPTAYVSMDDIQHIRDSWKGQDGLIPIATACERLGLRSQAVMKRAEELNIEIRQQKLRQSGGRPAYFLAEDDVRKIADYSAVPENMISYKEAAKEIGIGINTLATKVKELELDKHMYLIQGQASAHISSEDIKKIKSIYEGPAGWTSVRELGVELGKSSSELRYKIGRLGIKTVQRSAPASRKSFYISPESVEAIRRSFDERA